MKSNNLIAASLLLLAAGAPAFAQTTSTPPSSAPQGVFQTNVTQQNNIESGLQSGELSTGEAARLERGEANIDRMETYDEKNGMTPQDVQQIQNAQNREANRITRDDTNNVTGNPNSPSSQRMQRDVQRDANQQGRIAQGSANGSLSSHQLARLEHGQARDDRSQYRAGRDGHISAREQARLRHREDHQSDRIAHWKHDGPTGDTTP